MKNILLLVIFFLNSTVFAQQCDWVKNIPPMYSDIPPLVETNSSGDVFTTSVYEANISYTYNIKTVKRTNTGQIIWTKTIGSPVNEYAFTKDFVIDSNNIYILGFFVHSITFANTTIYSNNWQIFIACYGQDGTEKWIKDIPLFSNAGNTMTIDNDGDLIFANYSTYPTNIWTVKKISSTGIDIWTKTFVCEAQIASIKCDTQNNIYLAGSFNQYQLKVDSIVYYQDTGYYYNGYLAKFKTTGEIESIEVIQGGGLDNIEIDNNDNIFVSGNYNRDGMRIRQEELPAITPCPYYCNRCFIAKLNTDDSCSWVKVSYSGSVNSFILSRNGGLYVYGDFSFDSLQSNNRIQIIKYNTVGEIQWTQESNSTGTDMAYNGDKTIYFTGNYGSTVWFGNDTIPLTGYNYHVFLAKLTDNQTALITDVGKSDNNYLKVFPNPSIGIFSVDLKNNKIDTKICVYDVYGNCFYTKNFRNNASTQIDLRSQPKGIYFMEIVADGEKTVKKIVLQ